MIQMIQLLLPKVLMLLGGNQSPDDPRRNTQRSNIEISFSGKGERGEGEGERGRISPAYQGYNGIACRKSVFLLSS